MYANHRTFSFRHINNRHKIMREYEKASLHLNSFPSIVHIENTNCCNLRCPMCPQPSRMTRPKGFMEIALYRSLLAELKEMPVELIYLHQFGEPLLHPQTIEMIRLAKEAGLFIGLSTNAVLLNREMSERILTSGLDLLILSLDGGREDLYEMYRVGADWKTVEHNVRHFLEIRKRISKHHSPHTVIQTISMKGNENSLSHLYEKFASFNCGFTNKPYNEWGGQDEHINKLSTNENPSDGSRHRRCEKLYKLLTIEWDGTVVPCTRFYDDQYTYGKFPGQTLKEIWNGPNAVAFRQKHSRDRCQINFCKTCIYDGPNFLERQGLRLLDNLFIEKLIMDIPFIRWRSYLRKMFLQRPKEKIR